MSRLGVSTAARPLHYTIPILAGGAFGGMLVYFSGGMALLAPALAGVVLLFLLVRFLEPSDEDQGGARLMWWTMASFAAHLAFGLFVTSAGGAVSNLLEAPDSVAYNELATRILLHWTGDFPMPKLPAGKEGYYYMLASLYWVFGIQTVAGIVVNAVLSASIVPLVTDTTRRLFGPAAAHRVPPLLLILPAFMLWPSQLIKEAPVLFLVAFAANCATRLTERFRAVPLAGLAAAMALFLTFRGVVALVFAGGFLASIAFGRRQLLGGLGTGLGLASLVLLLLAFGVGYSGFDAAVNVDLERADVVRRDLARTATTGFDTDVDISTSKHALTYLPRGLVNFMFGPFPWQIQGMRQVPVVLDAAVWWLLIPSLCVGLRRGWQMLRRRIVVLGLPAFAAACLLSLAVGNFGLLARERMQVVVLLIPLVALGMSVRAARRETAEPQAPDAARPEAVPQTAGVS